MTPQLISNATSCANLREKNHKFPLSFRGCKLRYVYDGKFPRTTFLLCMAARDVGAEFAGSEHEKRNSIFFADSKKTTQTRKCAKHEPKKLDQQPRARLELFVGGEKVAHLYEMSSVRLNNVREK